MIMFFLALLVLSTVVAAPTVISSIQREKEAEMVWRGKQYVRGIRMYYMKMRRFPTSLDDLTQPKIGLRFMRQAYKDPMNTTDGSWRLIFIGPNGQLIGSLNNQTLGMLGMFGAGGASGMQNRGLLGSNGLSGGTLVGTGTNGPGTAVSATSSNAAASSTGDTSSSDPNNPNGGTADPGTPQSQGMMDSSNTIGGNIIGVGSKVNKKSFLWYQQAKNYRQFEFIWDPSKDLTMGKVPLAPVPPQQNTPGTTPPRPTQNPGVTPGADPGLPLQAPPPSN
jgi:hypothetical protein